MKTIGAFLAPAAAALILPCFVSSASATQYFTVDFPGAIYTTLNGGPNPSGEVVGTYVDKANKTHGFMLTRERDFKTIDFPGALQTALNGWIDPEGDIVGQYTDAKQTTHGFLLERGTFQTIDYPGSTFTSLGGINQKREIVGTYCIGMQCGVFTYKHGSFNVVTISNGSLTSGDTISPSGTLVAGCLIGGHTHICLIDDGHTTVIDYPGAVGTSAGAANTSNDVVGAWADSQLHVHGFLERHGVFTPLDPPGSTFTFASGISEQDTVIGQYIDAAGKSHGFVALPFFGDQDRRDGNRFVMRPMSEGGETRDQY